MVRLCSGCGVFDDLLGGGFESDVLTTVFGPAGSGKTCSCILACLGVVRAGKKVIFVDTEGGFSVERIKQIAPEDFESILENIIFFRPVSFDEQRKIFDKLKLLVNDRIGLVVVDTISILYRAELGRDNDVYRLNKELGLQLSFLSEIVRKKGVPVILTSQVYSSMDESGGVSLVGGDIVRYWSKCLVELKNFKAGLRCAILRKHRSMVGEKEVFFRIVDSGFDPVDIKQ